MFEVLWDTKQFADLDWPADGSNPFVWSFGDATGYANHADYVFGWKDNALQRVLDSPCYFYTNCSEYGHKLQTVEDMNRCEQKAVVQEEIDGCKWVDYTFLREKTDLEVRVGCFTRRVSVAVRSKLGLSFLLEADGKQSR